MRGLVLSDLHLLSERSQGDRCRPLIDEALTGCQTLVLNGDIFDFHWSRLREPEAGLDYAVDWLEALLHAHRGVQVHYVLGNHDCQRGFRQRLEGIESGCERFRWHPEHLVLGDCLFVHGDLHLVGQRFRREELPRGQGPFKSRCYTALHAGRVHHLLKPLHGKRRCSRRIYRRLSDERHVDLQRLRHVYFGHTHVAFSGYRHRGISFHNTGAAIAGTRFQALHFQMRSA